MRGQTSHTSSYPYISSSLAPQDDRDCVLLHSPSEQEILVLKLLYVIDRMFPTQGFSIGGGCSGHSLSQNSNEEALTPSVTEFGGRTFRN